jgi:acetylornithine deacetylase/succinyl-diaminopimelate desuccinylase-like protein
MAPVRGHRRSTRQRTALGAAAAVAIGLATDLTMAQTSVSHPGADAQALTLAKESLALRSVAGPGNQTSQVAALYEKALVAGGFSADRITIAPVGDTAFLIARWPGSDPTLKALVLSGHMDVVEAKREDWQRDPFVPVVENGYLYGRGASDMKTDGAIALAALIELRRQGYSPRRTIIIEFSGDEETAMKTSATIATQLADADLVVNIDGGGGTLDETTGQPKYFTWQGAEKTYADFELSVTNPGGHSSEPRKDNAINTLAAALTKIAGYQFKPELNDLTRAYFQAAAALEDPAVRAAMTAFAANPADAGAIATLTSKPELIGQIGTTCVATLVSGGHAQNALPQRASANVNCRIFPGHPPDAIMTELEGVVGDTNVQFKDVTEGTVPTDASPMRQDFVDAVTSAMAAAYPGVPVFPSMAVGASDSMWFRAQHVPSYGASPSFIKPSDDFSHGLNERLPVSNIGPGITYYLSLLRALSK